ncbi:adenine phosphoribosyltransferase [Halobacteriales archaeon QS_8_69_26]|nr:MAG: adenine phosphoribosyltransferase [Halobacteriales archaeon QS_8_69_26]
MTRAEKARLQLHAVAVLRTLKRSRTYDELSDLTGFPANDCNRYVNGHVLPGIDRAREVVGEVGRGELAEELRRRVRTDDEGYVDVSAAVYDQPFLDLVAAVAVEELGIDPPDVVLTAATDGITLAAAFASAFDARSAYAKKSKETAIDEFIESRERLQSGIEITYYLPASAIDPGESVLVVDDLIRSGETQALLLDIADRADAEVLGVFAMIAVGRRGIDRARERTDAPVETLVGFD